MHKTRIQRTCFRAALAAAIIACSSGGATDAKPDTTAAVIPTVPPPPLPTLLLSSDSVVASVIAGAAQSSQTIDLSAGTATPLTGITITDVTFGAGQPSGWLAATVSAPTPPAKILVTINASALNEGSYDAVVRVAAADVAPKSVRVRLTVRPRPRLALDKNAASFDGALGAALPPQTIAIAGVGGSVDGVGISKPDCGTSAPWMSASVDSARTPTTLRVSVSSTDLAAGTYACSLVVSTSQALVDSSSQTVKVTLTLRSAPRIAISADTIGALAFRQFDAAPTPVSITNIGTGTLSGLSIGQITYDSAASGWLTASLDSTTAPATLTLKASARALHAGVFYATVPILSSTAGVVNSPKTVVMKFLVSPQPPGLAASPASVSFTRRQGDPAYYAATSVAILPTGDGIVTHMGFNNPPPGPTPPFPYWIQASLGCTGPEFDAPCTLQLAALPNSLTPGTYSGTVTVKSFAQNLTASVSVTLTITP